MNIAALLDLLHIPYTGSGPQALALSTDKAVAKAVLSIQGIRVPKFQVAYQAQTQLDAHLSFPLIVKPLFEDGSYGIAGASVVESNIALEDRIAYILDKFHQASIVEEFIDGREINAAIWGNEPPTVLPLSEIEFRDFPSQMPKIVSFDAKWTAGSFEYQHTIPVCAASLPDDVELAVRDVALRSHLAIGCRD